MGCDIVGDRGEVVTQEDCLDAFWQTVAELTIKYADRLAEG
ncbi:hypothetical protein [Streptomyces antarcticus]|nr:hypothetical protein [Streptomyces sp. H34-AA3]MCY0945336.1 hypothetical protein [Streptomyces sp. H34-AA3]